MPQQTDLISNFVKLSIRRGSSLTTLSKSPDHLRTVVDAFKATARDPLHPHEDDAKKFLAEIGYPTRLKIFWRYRPLHLTNKSHNFRSQS